MQKEGKSRKSCSVYRRFRRKIKYGRCGVRIVYSDGKWRGYIEYGGSETFEGQDIMLTPKGEKNV